MFSKKDLELTFCQINICSLSNLSAIALEKYASDKNIDILAVQETKTSKPALMKNFKRK